MIILKLNIKNDIKFQIIISKNVIFVNILIKIKKIPLLILEGIFIFKFIQPLQISRDFSAYQCRNF